MSIIVEPDDFNPIFQKMEIPERFINNIGYFSFYTKDHKVRTYKIKIDAITSVFDDERNIGTFLKFIYFETLIVNKIINKIFQTNLKEEQGYEIESGYFSKDFFSIYYPYGFLDVNFIGKNIQESKVILVTESVHNKDYSVDYRKYFPKNYYPSL